MPIVEGRYEAKISTAFASIDDGIDEIKAKLKKARRVRIGNIPMSLLEELKPLLEGKDVRIVLPLNEKPTSDLMQLCPTATTKAKIYKEYKGKEASAGSVNFPDRIFNIVWRDDKILDIDSMDYSKCVKCLNQTFDSSWRYAEKHKK